MKATISINIDNAAFTDDPGAELAHILRELADHAENGDTGRPLMDVNGNRVGLFEIEE